MKHLYLTLSAIGFSAICMAQSSGTKFNPITTAVPFVSISPDARSGGLGDAGAALSPDANSTYWNPSKLAFLEDGKSNVSLSYSPWMRRMYSGLNLAYLSYVNKLSDSYTIGSSLRYFNLGKVDSYDGDINSLGTLRPNEFSLDVSIARKYGNNLALGLTARYIRSNIPQGAFVNGVQAEASNGFAADVSMYYTLPKADGGSFAFGANISNIGTKMSYNNGTQRYFLPTNLRVGVANTFHIDETNDVTLAFDVNKLLVPTPPLRDASGNIISGTDDTEKSVVSGIFGSFGDAPGGFKEEFQEISFSPAFEYLYRKQFALRMGYFYENPNKGDRQYLTLGLGFKTSDLRFDFSYLSSKQTNSPLAGVMRLSAAYAFGSVEKKK
jgi:hypothetical protein